MQIQELIIVTQASARMRGATVRKMTRRGLYVLASARRDSSGTTLLSAGILPVILDITNQDHIAALLVRIDCAA